MYTSPILFPSSLLVGTTMFKYARELLFKNKPLLGNGRNSFIDWLDFYLKMAVLVEPINILKIARISYHISAMIISSASGWFMFYLKYNDITLNTDALLHAVLVAHTLFVYIVYLRKKCSLFKIAKNMEERFKEYKEPLSLEKYHVIWDKGDKLSLIMMKLGIVSCLVVYFTYIGNALFISHDRKLLYPLWTPLSINFDIIYYLFLSLQLTIFCLYSFIHVSGCGFCIGGSHFIGASFDVLGQVFQDLCKQMVPNHLEQKKSHDLAMHEKMKFFVQAHVAVLNLAKEYKMVYESIIVEVLIACEIVICFAGFQTVLAVESNNYARAGAVLFMALLLIFHLFMFCYPGQHVYTKSEQFRESVYLSGWEDQSLGFQKAVRIILLFTLQPVSISYRGLFRASMTSFLNALRTAFSYINILLILRELK